MKSLPVLLSSLILCAGPAQADERCPLETAKGVCTYEATCSDVTLYLNEMQAQIFNFSRKNDNCYNDKDKAYLKAVAAAEAAAKKLESGGVCVYLGKRSL